MNDSNLVQPGNYTDFDDDGTRTAAVQAVMAKLDTNQLIESIAHNYSSAFIVNVPEDSYRIIVYPEKFKGLLDGYETFTELKELYLKNVTHPADVGLMRREMDYGTIAKKLGENDSYNVEYRSLVYGNLGWHEMNITRLSENEIAVGFIEKDLEITKRHLEEMRYREYFALFLADIDSQLIKIVKDEERHQPIPVGKSVEYTPYLLDFSKVLDDEPKEFFRQLSDISYVKKEFEVEDKRSHSYKSSYVNGGNTWIEVTMYVILRHDDGTPAAFTIGFSVADALATANNELQSRLKANMLLIGGLASGYNALYYINIDENILNIYALDETKYPGSRAIFEGEEKNFYKIIGGYGLSEQVHPDDRHLFEDFGPEWIRRILRGRKKYAVRFRAVTENGYRWDEMEFTKNEGIDEQANAVVVGFTDRDAEIRREQAINNTFDVLGRELSPEESINRILTIAGEFYAAERCYVFEYSRNIGLIDNTYEWCADGIEPMIDKLQQLPIDVVEGWNREFERQGAFHMDALDSEHNTEETIAVLEMQGIQSLVAAPLMNGDEIVGFIGVDNPTMAKDDISILVKSASVAYSEILKRRENDEEHVTLNKLTDAFLSVYYADLSTDYMRTWKMDEEYVDAYGTVHNYSVAMGGYVRENISERDRERCIRETAPEYVLEQFKTRDRFSIDMTDIMLGYERSIVFDFIKVSEDGSQLVICCRDVTDTLAREKEQQKLLEEARVAAEAANRSKTNFLFNMSHDIRTPMNAIRGFTTMAKKNVDDTEKVTNYLDKIDISGQQLLTLINQVLEMARIESGKAEVEMKSVNVAEEFESMVTVLSEQAKTNGLEFNHTLGNVEHNRVLADEARMSSITLNIVGNAMKYTPKGGTVNYDLKEIEGRKPGYATFIFTVSDTGIGMSEEYLEKLFEPFTRENSSTVSKIQGTGLGMSIVKELVDLLGGSIEVSSELGKGTTFEITIDFKIDEKADTEINEENILDTVSFEGRRVLLVEDNEMNREIARDILEEQGLIVEEAEDGDVAVSMVLDILERGEFHYYDFILMDIQMPRMNGFEATEIIRGLPPHTVHIPIIAMTANAFEEDRQNALAAGMDEHLAKPIDVQKAFMTIAKFLK